MRIYGGIVPCKLARCVLNALVLLVTCTFAFLGKVQSKCGIEGGGEEDVLAVLNLNNSSLHLCKGEEEEGDFIYSVVDMC